jgi:DNA-binding MarR family transcriptional regulator
VDASGEEHEFLKPEEYETWNALLSLSQGTLRALDVELQSASRLSVNEFDVLITLFNAEERRLGLTSLAQSAMLSPSGLTHLITRLERHGLVDRVVDPADRRKFFAVLTDAGDARLRQARPVHNRVLRSLLLTHIGATDRRCLVRIWKRVAETGED